MKKSKCEKAAERKANFHKGDSLGAEVIREHRRICFMGGAEALLRYAKKNSYYTGLGERRDVNLRVLEEWVKGEDEQER
jgi:hypothetical protein